MRCSVRISALPNCMASGGAASAVSSFTPKQVWSLMVHGRRSRCGTAPKGLSHSSSTSSSGRTGEITQCPFFVMSVHSLQRNSMWSFADLCAPRLSAASSRLFSQAGFSIVTAAPMVLSSSNGSAPGSGKAPTSSARSPLVPRHFAAKLFPTVGRLEKLGHVVHERI